MQRLAPRARKISTHYTFMRFAPRHCGHKTRTGSARRGIAPGAAVGTTLPLDV